VAGLLAKGAAFLGLDVQAKDLEEIAKKNLSKTTLKDIDLASTAETEDIEKKTSRAKGGRRRGAQKAVGWGEQEDSMHLINKSLKRTHKMLTDLDKRMSKMKPAAAK
jgi:hypothetical protein